MSFVELSASLNYMNRTVLQQLCLNRKVDNISPSWILYFAQNLRKSNIEVFFFGDKTAWHLDDISSFCVSISNIVRDHYQLSLLFATTHLTSLWKKEKVTNKEKQTLPSLLPSLPQDEVLFCGKRPGVPNENSLEAEKVIWLSRIWSWEKYGGHLLVRSSEQVYLMLKAKRRKAGFLI